MGPATTKESSVPSQFTDKAVEKSFQARTKFRDELRTDDKRAFYIQATLLIGNVGILLVAHFNPLGLTFTATVILLAKFAAGGMTAVMLFKYCVRRPFCTDAQERCFLYGMEHHSANYFYNEWCKSPDKICGLNFHQIRHNQLMPLNCLENLEKVFKNYKENIRRLEAVIKSATFELEAVIKSATFELNDEKNQEKIQNLINDKVGVEQQKWKVIEEFEKEFNNIRNSCNNYHKKWEVIEEFENEFNNIRNSCNTYHINL